MLEFNLSMDHTQGKKVHDLAGDIRNGKNCLTVVNGRLSPDGYCNT